MGIIPQLFFSFLTIGAFTLGGGYAMLSIVEQTIVEKKKWLEKDDFWDMIAIVQSLPGVFAINTALYVGYKIKGIKGCIAAALGAMLPSMIIIIIVAMFFANLREIPTVEKFFKGIRPCVVALILVPSIKMVKDNKLTIKNIWIPIAATALVCAAGVSPTYVIIGAGLLGVINGLFFNEKLLNK